MKTTAKFTGATTDVQLESEKDVRKNPSKMKGARQQESWEHCGTYLCKVVANDPQKDREEKQNKKWNTAQQRQWLRQEVKVRV